MQSLDFLIADLEHFGESLWRNEEVGEKRFNFFISMVTAVIIDINIPPNIHARASLCFFRRKDDAKFDSINMHISANHQLLG